jgi:hypothetical protein
MQKTTNPVINHSQPMNNQQDYMKPVVSFIRQPLNQRGGPLTGLLSFFLFMFIMIDAPFEHLIHLYKFPCIAITQRDLLYAINIWSISI